MSSNHKGKPSGINKSGDRGTGVPSNISPATEDQDKKITEEYTDNDEQLSDNVKVRHPNRNVDKDDATNAGGYKN